MDYSTKRHTLRAAGGDASGSAPRRGRAGMAPPNMDTAPGGSFFLGSVVKRGGGRWATGCGLIIVCQRSGSGGDRGTNERGGGGGS
jgi:hypothetical protein